MAQQPQLTAADTDQHPQHSLVAATAAADPTSSFPSDPNISFSQLTGKWTYEDPNTGIESEYDEHLGKWRQLVDEEDWKAQQGAYGVEGVDEEQPAAPVARRQRKKRKIQDGGVEHQGHVDGSHIAPSTHTPDVHGIIGDSEASQAKAGPSRQPRRERVNASLFISSLPLDATSDEVAKVFSRYGILAESDDGSPRVKLYVDDKTGMFKGEALLTYFKAESCQLAIQLLDGTCLRAAEGKSSPLMKVQMAEWSAKDNESSGKADDTQTINGEAGTTTASSSNEQEHGKAASMSNDGHAAKKQRNEQDKKKAAKRYARMNEKLAGWESESDEEPSSALRASGTQAGYVNPTSRTLILKKIFTLSELSSDPSLLLDLAADIREECSNFGDVTSVTLWDLEPEGVVSVKFRRPEEAQRALRVMHGRFFAGRRIEAFLSEGNKVKFRRTKGDVSADGDDAEGGEKQDAFGQWLEGEGNREE